MEVKLTPTRTVTGTQAAARVGAAALLVGSLGAQLLVIQRFASPLAAGLVMVVVGLPIALLGLAILLRHGGMTAAELDRVPAPLRRLARPAADPG